MEISAKKSDKKGIMYVCHEISKELGVTAQTVYNYTKGRITDGYLADSIISALKKYRHNKRDN
jgi:predicted transcriptional regulator